MNKTNKRTRAVKGVAEVALFSAFLVLCSFVTVPIGAVPVTLQTVGIIVSAGLLGVKKGVLVTVIYILLGLVGMPVFSGFSGGFSVVTSPAGGFLLGFVPLSVVTGFLVSRLGSGFWRVLLSSVVGMAVLYIFAVVFYANLYLDKSAGAYLSAVLSLVVPFLLPDAVKTVFSALLVSRLKRFVDKAS